MLEKVRNKKSSLVVAIVVIVTTSALVVIGAGRILRDKGTSLSEITQSEIPIIPDVPKDAIPPLDFPNYEIVSEVDWLSPLDFVIGFHLVTTHEHIRLKS